MDIDSDESAWVRWKNSWRADSSRRCISRRSCRAVIPEIDMMVRRPRKAAARIQRPLRGSAGSWSGAFDIRGYFYYPRRRQRVTLKLHRRAAEGAEETLRTPFYSWRSAVSGTIDVT